MIQTLRFEAIYESCYEQVYRFSLSYTGNPALAEEVTQEAFARLLQQRLRDIRKPVAWLIRVARNLAADALREKGHRMVFLHDGDVYEWIALDGPILPEGRWGLYLAEDDRTVGKRYSHGVLSIKVQQPE